MDLKVCTLKGIHTFRKDYKSQMTKCSPWETEVQTYPPLKKKVVEFMRCWQTITTLFANRPFQPKPKAAAKKYNLVPLTGSNRAELHTPSMPPPTSPAAPVKITENSKHCVICAPLGKICLEEFALSPDWNEDKEDQAKDKDKDNEQNQTQTNPSFSTVMALTLKPPKPFITKYFDSMSSKTPIMYISKEECRCDTIMAQQELNTTECEVLHQDLLADID